MGRRQQPGAAAAPRDRVRHADDQGAGDPQEGRPVGDARVQRDARVPRRVRAAPRDAAADRAAREARHRADAGGDRQDQVGGVLGRAAVHRRQRELPPTHQASIPAMKGVANQPGLPRKPEEVRRATATFKAQGCEVKSNGARLEISFPGVELGIFAGRLQYDVFKGSNLIRQVVIAKTDAAVGRLQVRRRAQGSADPGLVSRRLARPRRPLAGPAVWRAGQPGSRPPSGAATA